MDVAFTFVPGNAASCIQSSKSSSFLSTSPLPKNVLIQYRRPRTRPTRISFAPRAAAAYPLSKGVAGECSKKVQASETLPQLFQHLNSDHGDRLALIDEHRPKGARVQLKYSELSSKIHQATASLRRNGVTAGDVIAVFAENSHRWLIVDQAVMGCGAATAVRSSDSPIPELDYIYDHSGSRMLFVENTIVLNRFISNGFDISRPDLIVLLFGEPDSNSNGFPVISFDEFLSKGEKPTEEEVKVVGKASDIATILYTSGTTGKPKGVVLTHSNILHQVGNISIGRIDPTPGMVFLSVLPCWHIFERTAAYYCLSKAMTVVYSSKRRFRDDLAAHRPHVLVAVPRVFENLHSAVMMKLKAASATRKAIFTFFTGLSISCVQAARRMRGLSLKHMSQKTTPLGVVARLYNALKFVLLFPIYALANAIVWRKIRASTGGRVQLCVCGGGLLSDHLEDFFEAARIEICVGYGLTETSPVIANRFWEHNVRGSAGLPMPETEVKIIDLESGKSLPTGQSGVIHAKGPQVFTRYLGNDQATNKAFDEEGFFDTGDLGYIAPTGDLVVTGRSKDVIVLSNGENVEPEPIEHAILSSPLIDQIMLVGQDERALGALVVPQLDALLEHEVIDNGLHERARELLKRAGDNSAEIRSLELEMGLHPTVYSKLHNEIAEKNESRTNYSRNERISGFRVVLTPFSVENGMMTQTLKIKKQIVVDKFDTHIRSLYQK